MAERLRRDGTPVSEPQPARGYSWAPFAPGNTASLKHGAHSERTVAARAEEIRSLVTDAFPFLCEPLFGEALERYCRAEARARLLHDYCVEKAEAEGVEAVPRTLWQEASWTALESVEAPALGRSYAWL